MSFVLPFTTPATVEVFAVEDTNAQLTWRRLPAGELGVVAHHATGSVEYALGPADQPGAADIAGFTPDTSTVIDITVDGRPIAQQVVTTHPTLDDGPVTRIATISDLHLGETGFGLVREFREPATHTPYPLRCAIAAAREAQDWGAELLVIKGDITEEGRPHEWELFDQLLDTIDIPVLAIPGNHDTVGKRDSVDATDQLQRRGLFPDHVHVHDLDQARVVLADSTVPRRSFGRLQRRVDELCEAIAGDRPALVFTHHHLEDKPVPWFWPLGVHRFDNAPLMAALREANQDLVISSGHTHRSRARTEGSTLITEVGATKDYPGVWAGYVLHHTGVRQAVRRVAETTCASWNDRTHAVVAGIWGRWSPGTIHGRCVTHQWPGGRRETDLAGVATQSLSPSAVSDRA